MSEKIHLLRESELVHQIRDTMLLALHDVFDALSTDERVDAEQMHLLRSSLEERLGQDLPVEILVERIDIPVKEDRNVSLKDDPERESSPLEKKELRVDRHSIVEELKGLM